MRGMAMAFIKSVLTFVAVFTLLGGVIGTFSAPQMVRGELCGFANNAANIAPCAETVDKATASVLRYQRYGGIGGAGLGLFLGIGFNAWRRSKKSTGVANPPAPPA